MMADDTAGGRLQQLEDSEAIRRLLLDYGRCLDTRDFEGLSELFSDDCEFVLAFDTVKGRDGVLKAMNDMLGVHLPLEPGRDLHVFANPQVDVHGDTATSRSFWLYITPDEHGFPRIALFGHYEDELVRLDGRWKFKRRTAPLDIGVLKAGVPGPEVART
jgi:ketosteroid isomerase-like protein